MMRQFHLLAMAILLAGCATEAPYRKADALFCGESYEAAAACVGGDEPLTGKSGDVLKNLYAGSAHFAGQNHAASIADFTRAEAGLKEQDLMWSVGRGMTSDYLARTYDETMVNLYQALSYLQQENVDRARTEFNRVFERQGRAATRNAELITKKQAEIAAAQKSKENKAALEKTRGARCDGIAELEGELEKWGAYADYMNPAAVFLCGAFRLLWGEDLGDVERGLVYFKRAYGMQPAKVTETIINLMDARADGRADWRQKYVLVVFENGMGPQKVEERKELVIPYRYPIYAGVALPMLQHRPQAQRSLKVYGNGRLLGETETICDMDRVIATEFREELKWTSASAYVSACVKIGLQIVAMEVLRASLDKEVRKGKMTPFARDMSLVLAGAGLSAACKATTRADTRIWSTLPRDYQAAFVPRPDDGVIALRDATGTKTLAEVHLPAEEKSAFVYVKITTPSSQPVVFTARGRN